MRLLLLILTMLFAFTVVFADVGNKKEPIKKAKTKYLIKQIDSPILTEKSKQNDYCFKMFYFLQNELLYCMSVSNYRKLFIFAERNGDVLNSKIDSSFNLYKSDNNKYSGN